MATTKAFREFIKDNDLVKLKGYIDKPRAAIYGKLTPLGRVAWKVEEETVLDRHDKEVKVYWLEIPSCSGYKKCKTLDDVTMVLQIKKPSIEDIKASDKDILKWISNQLGFRKSLFTMEEVGTMAYTVSGNNVSLFDTDSSDFQLCYNVFTKGGADSDDVHGLANIGLSVPAFIAFLEKAGAKKRKPVRRPKAYNLYD